MVYLSLGIVIACLVFEAIVLFKFSKPENIAHKRPATEYVKPAEYVDEYAGTGLYDKGFALLDAGKYSEALKIFKDAVEANPKSSWTWYQMGNYLLYVGNFKEANKSYDKSIAINPKNISALRNKRYVLEKSGKYEEVVKTCDETIKIDPQSAMAWYRKGVALIRLGKYDDGFKACNKALEIAPNFDTPYKEDLITLLKQIKKTKEGK